MANIREAILKAADHIERFPDEFDYYAMSNPDHPHCGTPGCALGWIGYFSKLHWFGGTGGNNSTCPLLVALNVTEMYFYIRLYETIGSFAWMKSPKRCATALRIYADRYHPAEPSRELKSGSEIVKDFLRKPMREIA